MASDCTNRSLHYQLPGMLYRQTQKAIHRGADELQEQLEVNIALIGYIKEEIKKEEEDAKK